MATTAARTLNRLFFRLEAASVRFDRVRGKKIVHFLHIGKTGGTAVKAALGSGRTGEWRVVKHRHNVTLQQVPESESSVFFVRDPLTRFVSGFYSRQREGMPRYHVPWSEGERRAFGRFETPNQLALALSAEDGEERDEAIRALRAIQHVRDSYWRWCIDEEYVERRRPSILFVGSQERLSSDYERLAEILGVPGRLPADDVGAHRNPRGLDTHLDETAVANLRQWYARDYAFLRLMRGWFPHLPSYEA